MTRRERFINACRSQAVDRPPIWMMRQAGRALPEYRAVKEKHTFLEIVQTPELATEVTLQPIRRFGFDAAILFSDILVICEALGQPYAFRETGGIEMARHLDPPCLTEGIGLTQCFTDDQDVAEKDGGIKTKAADGLKGDFGRQLGGLNNLQKGMLFLDGSIFRQGSPGLAHHPDGRAVYRLTAAGVDESFTSGHVYQAVLLTSWIKRRGWG